MTSKEALNSLMSEIKQLNNGKITSKQMSKINLIAEDLDLLDEMVKWYDRNFLHIRER